MAKSLTKTSAHSGPAVEIDPGFDNDVSMSMVQNTDDFAKIMAENAALKAQIEMRKVVSTEVSEQLRLEEAKRRDFAKMRPTAAPVMPPKPDEKLITVSLDRNYVPMGYYEVAGYQKAAVTRRTISGATVELEPAEFVKGEKKPPSISGTGYASKIWAGTKLRVPESEARHIRTHGIGSIELD